MIEETRRVDFKKVDRLRLDLGLNKQSFCRKAKTCEYTYNRLAVSKKVTDDEVIRIAKALGVKPSTLIYWENEPETEESGSGRNQEAVQICLVEAKTKKSNTKPAKKTSVAA